MKKVVCMFSGEWILKHRGDDPMPVSKLNIFLSERFADRYFVDKDTYSILEFSLDVANVTVAQICAIILPFLQRNYDDFEEKFFNAEVRDAPDRVNPRTGKASDVDFFGMVNGYGTSTDSTTAGDVDLDDDRYAKNDDDGGQSCGKTSTTEEILAQIDNLISGAQFKAFAHEVAMLAPNIIRDKMQDVFFRQCLLFSINDGCGLEDYLNLYASLINVLGLSKMNGKVFFDKMEALRSDRRFDPGEVVIEHLTEVEQGTIVCIDLSDWMNDVRAPEFRSFMTGLAKMENLGVVAFRVPFIDKEVLGKISQALNDFMFIRELSFPPFSNEEIGRYADVEVSKYNFSMDEKAWDGFFRRIREESSDGRFYGVDTIRKVVCEMLYLKQLANAQNGENDRLIRAVDAEKLCGNEVFDNLSGMEMLDRLVGTDKIKQRVLEIISQIELARQNPSIGSPCLHMRFVGNPGTGKTTIARIIGKILKERGVLRIGEFHEQSGRDFCGRYIGETAPKTLSLCRAAYGSILFIDEAYSLYRGEDDTRDYGREALDTLIAEMENHRSDFVVIMAGYTDDINKMMKGNAGLESRMPYVVEFPNFTREQLYRIFESMVNGKLAYRQDMLDEAKAYFMSLSESFITSKEFSNARFVRNLYERVCAKAAMRCQLDGCREVVLTREDFAASVSDKEFSELNKKKRGIGFGQ